MVGIDDEWRDFYLELKAKDNEVAKKDSGHYSDIIAKILTDADPSKLAEVECEVVIHASIIDLLDVVAKPEHTSREGYTNILNRLYSDIVLRLAAMGVDVTNGE